jgi:hypothetical protein
MKHTHPALAQAVLGAVTALSLASAFHYYRSVDQKNRYYQDPRMTYLLGIQEQRLRGVIAMVPAEAVVGYMADLPAVPGAHWPTDAEFIFTAVRYALAPRLVIPYERGQKEDWVLGDFSKPFDLAQIENEDRLRLAKDLGSGLLLFQSE